MSDAGRKLRFLLELQENLGGCIPFERWMREALYHREFGYYTANIREFGRRGDFTTWPALDKGLGRAIAGWALQNRPSKRWDLIEIGAGSGELAASILKDDRLVEPAPLPHRRNFAAPEASPARPPGIAR